MNLHTVESRRSVGGGGGFSTGGTSEAVVPTSSYYDNNASRFCTQNFHTNSQTFDIIAASHFSSKSPEGIMHTSVAFPFTSAQWKELERQAMIYKYMIYSVPVPPDLLLPLSSSSAASAIYSVRYGKNGDLEPGRCKRTDGKKWRCSKDVAPNQKYCERHLHRGRPRSRKPVEDKNINGESNKKTKTTNLSNFSATNDKPLLLFEPKNDLNVSNACSSNRDSSLMMMETDPKRRSFVETNLGFPNGSSSSSPSLFYQDYLDQNQLLLSPYSNFATNEIDAPISFIDAVDPPSLDLSIAMAADARVTCCDDQTVTDHGCFGPVYWSSFARGGPLAEALNTTSSHDSVATSVESPTGVPHRLFPYSDGSVCNSPTFPAPMTSEVAFRWLN